MKKYVSILCSVLILIGCVKKNDIQPLDIKFYTEGKDVHVYTSAAQTNLRLTETSTRFFDDADQPLGGERGRCPQAQR